MQIECNHPHTKRAKGCRSCAAKIKVAKRVYPPLKERFWSKVEKTSTCWIWTGARNNIGYGSFYMGALRPVGVQRLVTAHRFAYELLVGLIPDGCDLDHLCRVRACVRPSHLEPVSHQENIRRGLAGATVAARQRAKTHCPHGHLYVATNVTKHGHRFCIECRQAYDRKRFILYGRYEPGVGRPGKL